MTSKKIKAARLLTQVAKDDVISVLTTLTLLDGSLDVTTIPMRDRLSQGVANKLETAIQCLQAAQAALGGAA